MLTRGRRAVESLEAIITLPFAMLVVMMIVTFGFAIYAQQAVQNAANYGARVGATAQSCRSCVAYTTAKETVERSFVRNPRVEILAPGGVVGSTLRIRVSGQTPNLMGPLLAFASGGAVDGGPIKVSADATFQAEGW